MSHERRRLTPALLLALLLSLLIHGWLLSLIFGGQGLWLPGFRFPWQDRRIEADDLRVVVVPPPVTAAEPAVAPVAEPSSQAGVEHPVAREPALTPSASRAPSPPTAAAIVQEANPSVDAATGAVPAQTAPLGGDRPADAAPSPIPAPTVIAVERTDEATWVVPAVPAMPMPVIAAAPTVPIREAAIPSLRDPGDAMRVENARLEAERQEASRVEAAKLEATEVETAKLEAAKVEAAKLEAAKVETAKVEAAKVDAAKLEAAKLEAAKLEATEVEAAKLEAAKVETAKVEAAKIEAANLEAAKVEAAKVDAARVETANAELAKAEAANVEAAKAEVARVEAAKAEAARVEAAKAEAKVEAAKVESAKVEAAKAEAAKVEAARVEAAKVEAAKVEAAKIEAARGEAAKAEAAKVEAAREERLRAIGRQLDEEAARREAAAAAARLLPSSSSARRYWLFGRADPNPELIAYVEAWSRKIEEKMTFDIVREAAKQPHSNPLVTVAIRSDGSVESVNFVQSSGAAAIDEAIRRVVDSQRPYQPFPPGLAREFDVIMIRRTWHFDTAIRLY
jgi:uncharacterized protein YjbI with pentapeptide repeats